MNILVVNDDGYTTEGLKILAEAFKKRGNVYIVAPHTHQSGKSAAITVEPGLVVHRHEDKVWSVEGTPADCVKYALNALELDVDLVVSGINNGFNIGIDTVYSGTVGAAMEALLHDKKAIAFSGEYNNNDIARQEIEGVIDYIFKHDLVSNEYVLNVNFVKKAMGKSKGILITDLEIRKKVQAKTNGPVVLEQDKKTDVWALRHGYTSITPLKIGNGDSQLVEILNNKVNK